MPTAYSKLSENLHHFYDFTDKKVLYIGAAGRQLLDPATRVKKLVAIDKDVAALRQLQAGIVALGLQDSVEVIGTSFEAVTRHGDVIYFEFCLHEMDDPERALVHAKSLAPDVVVYDHSPGSEWSWYAAEEDKVSCSSAAMKRFGIRRHQALQAEQRFENCAKLIAKVGPQGPVAIKRAQRFAEIAPIVIPMNYELNLL